MLSRLGLLMSWEEVIDTFGDIIHGTSSDSLIIPEQVAEHGVKEEDWADLDSIPNDTDEIPW